MRSLPALVTKAVTTEEDFAAPVRREAVRTQYARNPAPESLILMAAVKAEAPLSRPRYPSCYPQEGRAQHHNKSAKRRNTRCDRSGRDERLGDPIAATLRAEIHGKVSTMVAMESPGLGRRPRRLAGWCGCQRWTGGCQHFGGLLPRSAPGCQRRRPDPGAGVHGHPLLDRLRDSRESPDRRPSRPSATGASASASATDQR